MIRPQNIAPPHIAPQMIAPARIPPSVTPPPPPVYAPTPYLLEFLTPAWNNENGAGWLYSDLGVFVAAGHVSYDAQTPNDSQWSAILANAEASIAGDARFSGYIAPNSATIQVQMQVLKFDFTTQSGFGIIAGWIAGGVGFLALFRAINGSYTIIGSQPIDVVSLVEGIWLKVMPVGLMALVNVYYKKTGVGWINIPALTTLDATAAAQATTKPAWLFTTSGHVSVPDAQIYHATKFEGNRDASILP